MVYRDGSLEEVTYDKTSRKTRSGQENGERGEKSHCWQKEEYAQRSREKKLLASWKENQWGWIMFGSSWLLPWSLCHGTFQVLSP